MLQDEEKSTLSKLGELILEQPGDGYRFNIDSVLLADFATLKKGRVADLGAGSGILGILLRKRGHNGPFVGVEIDATAARCCHNNYARHGIEGLVINQDLCLPHPELPRQGFMQIIANPPYGRPGTGRINPDPARARARHELALEDGALWARAGELLQPGGVLPAACPHSACRRFLLIWKRPPWPPNACVWCTAGRSLNARWPCWKR